MPAAETNCATCSVFFHLLVPLYAFSGTTTMSPGRTSAANTPPLHIPAEPLATEPFARIRKMAFLSATWVAPPPWLRYQPTLLPGRKLIAVGLYTAPLTITKFGAL